MQRVKPPPGSNERIAEKQRGRDMEQIVAGSRLLFLRALCELCASKSVSELKQLAHAFFFSAFSAISVLQNLFLSGSSWLGIAAQCLPPR